MELTTCTAPKCTANFIWVDTRTRPDLCIEHGQEADRDANGWTPENSVD